MPGLNPFRKNIDGSSAKARASTTAVNHLTNTLPLKALPQLPISHPRKPSLSLDMELEDPISSNGQTADPFNPPSSDSDSDDVDEDAGSHYLHSSKGSASSDDRPREYFGSAPHSAPSADGSTAAPDKTLFMSRRRSGPSELNTREANAAQGTFLAVEPCPNYTSSTSTSSRNNRDKKPPPPPKSHHGKRISVTADNMVFPFPYTGPSQYNSRLSFHGLSPDISTSTQLSGTPSGPSVSQLPASEYFSAHSESQILTGSNESPHRGHSQYPHRRPPTPPLSRRQSQTRRTKSTQSKSSGTGLTMSSMESESSYSSQPSSPSRSVKSVSSVSQERKHAGVVAASSRELGPASITAETRPDPLSSPTHPKPAQPGRRASSHSNVQSGSSSTAPPPPPPRRVRDSTIRSSDGGIAAQPVPAEKLPLPLPSNAHDILADLSRLQKEVDDLRGHYEGRRVS